MACNTVIGLRWKTDMVIMTPAQHYLAAEQTLKKLQATNLNDVRYVTLLIAQAQTHAMLATVSDDTFNRAHRIAFPDRKEEGLS